MTRAERLAQAEQLARDHLDRQRHRLAQVQAQRRAAEQQALRKRYRAVGKLVADAGLFPLDDPTLAGLFAGLARLVDTPNPVATLEGLLGAAAGLPGRSVEGCAQAAPGVAPDGASGALAR